MTHRAMARRRQPSEEGRAAPGRLSRRLECPPLADPAGHDERAIRARAATNRSTLSACPASRRAAG